MNKVELLAPVGKIENAYAAIENGADALFVGGKLFNARSYADNFNKDELKNIVDYAKLRDVKTYVTLNTLIKQDELQEVFDYVSELSAVGPDALIIQDIGIAHMVKEYFPHLRMHASTQMSAHSVEDVEFLQQLGFKRVVLARELQLKEIREIVENTSMEIECFIHGALCYSYSGQCLLSSMIGGRSGNRGKCAQPCRMQYTLLEDGTPLNEMEYMMSPKDICSLDLIPKLIESGIHSFKIEGRMKSPEYVASVIKAYRKYIDLAMSNQPYKVDEEDLKELQSVFNRGGFSKGYYFQKSGIDMLTRDTPKNIGLKIGKVMNYDRKTKMTKIISDKELHPGDGLEIWNTSSPHVGTGISKILEPNKPFSVLIDKNVEQHSEVYLSKNHELLKALKKTYEAPHRKLPIGVQIIGKLNEAIGVTLTYKDITVTGTGEILIPAQNAPITKEMAIKQLTKLGSTSFKADDVQCEWAENAYITVSKLNELRRRVAESLERKLIQKNQVVSNSNYDTIYQKVKDQNSYNPIWVGAVRTISQLKACLEIPEMKQIYWEWQYDEQTSQLALDLCIAKQKDFYLVLPPIIRNSMWKECKDSLEVWENKPITGYVIRNYGAFYGVQQSKKKKIIDFNMNVMNNESIQAWKNYGAHRVSISMECSKVETQTLIQPIERVVYGHIPVMTTEQCMLGNFEHCKQKIRDTSFKQYSIKDRKDIIWPIQTDCKACKMQVLTSKPILLDPVRDLETMGLDAYRLQFTKETPEEVQAILDFYFNGIPLEIQSNLGVFLKGVE